MINVEAHPADCRMANAAMIVIAMIPIISLVHRKGVQRYTVQVNFTLCYTGIPINTSDILEHQGYSRGYTWVGEIKHFMTGVGVNFSILFFVRRRSTGRTIMLHALPCSSLRCLPSDTLPTLAATRVVKIVIYHIDSSPLWSLLLEPYPVSGATTGN